MGKTWHKPHYMKSDLDPTTGVPRPGTLAPGLYCEDEATLDTILADPSVGKIEHAYWAPLKDGRPRAWPPITVSGIRVRVANEAELAILRGVTAKAPAVDTMEEAAAKVRALMERIRGEAPAAEVTPHPNRAARRAAASRGRS